MTNRYVTEAEKAGQKRRQDAYRKRLRDRGVGSHHITATESEICRLREILATWRDEIGLDGDLADAAMRLKPPAQE